MSRCLSFSAFCLLFALAASAAASPRQQDSSADPVKNYYQNSGDGYWWYKDPPPPRKDEEKSEKPSSEKKTKKEPELPSFEKYPVEKIWAMHPTEMKEVMKGFLDKAIQTPSPENVRDYLIVQDIARKKALAFTHVAGYAIQSNPELNLEKDAPTINPALDASARMQTASISAAIEKVSDDYGVLFFTKKRCEICQSEGAVIEEFKRRYRLPVTTVDVDKYPLSIERFRVTTVPMMVLVRKSDKQFLPVNSGATSLTEVEANIQSAINLMTGDINPQQYGLYDYQKGGGFDPTVVIDPSQLRPMNVTPVPAKKKK